MAYTDDQLKLALGRRRVLFVKKQTARGTLAEPAATDTVLITQGGEFKQQYDYHEDTQKRDTRDELEGVVGILPHGEFDITAYLKPSGTAGTDPELADVLEGVFGAKNAMLADTVSATPAPTVGGCRVTDGTRFAVGMMRYIALASGDYLRRISGVSTNDITWEPDLPSAPATGAAIKAGVQFAPATDRSDYSIWLKDDDTVYAFQDAGFNKLSAKVDGKSPLELGVNGGFIKFYMAGTDEVDTAGIDAVATTLPVKDGMKFIAGAGCIVKLESEIMKVSARSGNNLTVVRGYMSTTAASHAAGVAVTPWYPTITESGSIVHGKLGKPQWKLGNTWEDLPVVEVSLEYDNTSKWLDDEKNGEGVSAGWLDGGARKVSGTIRFLYRRKHSNLYALADAETQARVVVPVGNLAGKTIVFTVEQAKILRPDKTGDEERIMEVALRVHATTAYNNSMFVHAV